MRRLILEPITKLIRAYWNAAWRLSQEHGLPLASAMTFSGILAMFPFLIFVTALAGFLGGEGAADQAVQALFDRLPHEVADTLAPEVRRVLGVRRGDFLTFGILLTVFFSTSGVESVRTALNSAYRLTETRLLWWRWLQSSAFVVAGAAAMLVFGMAVIITPLVQGMAVEALPWLAPHVQVFSELRLVIGTVVLTLLLLAMHFWLPDGRRRLSDVWPGVLHTLVLWLIGGTVYSAYLSYSTYYITTYAGLANVMIALMFFYVLAVIFVFGAELNRAFIEEREVRARKEAAARLAEGAPGPPGLAS